MLSKEGVNSVCQAGIFSYQSGFYAAFYVELVSVSQLQFLWILKLSITEHLFNAENLILKSAVTRLLELKEHETSIFLT